MNLLPEFLKQVLIKIEKTATEDDVVYLLDYLSEEYKEFERLATTSFKYEEYRFQISHKLYGEPYVKKLKMLNKNNISIAPLLAATATKETSLYFIYKLPETTTEELIPYEKGSHLVSNKTKEAAFKELEKLVKGGFVNPHMLKGSSAWYITPETHKIIVPDWSQLRQLEENEGKAVLNNFKQTLFS